MVAEVESGGDLSMQLELEPSSALSRMGGTSIALASAYWLMPSA
ncbi:MAG TPA: hypothetical protein VE175_11895 [Woeseiaceae bacterium]|nr:hypothetical protein [Woeseiaceae bacterium]